MPSVLFVCTANVCRSPMAAALFSDLVAKSGLADSWHVGSAGTQVFDGFPASRLTQSVLQERGLGASDHRAHQLTADLLQAYDLVLVMEQGHRESLCMEFPEFADRVHLITELDGADFGIREPFERELAAYRDLRNELTELLERCYTRMADFTEALSPSDRVSR